MNRVAVQVARQHCRRCGEKHANWDGILHQSSFGSLPEIGPIKGELYLFCPLCNVADSYYVNWESGLSYRGQIDVGGPVPNEWLKEKISRPEFAAYTAKILAKPDAMESFKVMLRIAIVKLRPDDEVWSFSSPTETWTMLMGRAGFAAVSRDQEVVFSFLTDVN